MSVVITITRNTILCHILFLQLLEQNYVKRDHMKVSSMATNINKNHHKNVIINVLSKEVTKSDLGQGMAERVMSMYEHYIEI